MVIKVYSNRKRFVKQYRCSRLGYGWPLLSRKLVLDPIASGSWTVLLQCAAAKSAILPRQKGQTGIDSPLEAS